MSPLPALRRLLVLGALLAPLAAPGAAQATDDALWGQQWALQAGALDGPAAWALGGDGSGTLVAVLDTGVDASHPDLRDALWQNPGEVPGNGADDDGDGWVDDVHGADLVRRDGDPDDEEGHGTHVAGLIAATQDDTGVTGLAPGARIMAVKVLDQQRSGTTDDVAAGIRYALAHGADVINVSVNGDAPGRALTEAVAAADAAGVPVVASAGNDGRSLDLKPSYPAALGVPTVLAVAGGTRAGLLASFSNFGSRTVDLAAPGEGVLSTRRGGGYELRSGTSMAAPYVTATLALLHGARPELGGAELVATLRGTARRAPGLEGLLRAGALDPVAALRAVVSPERVAALEAERAVPTLTARVARRATRTAAARKRRPAPAPRLLVTWRVVGPVSRVARFEVRAGGRTLAERPGSARGVWLTTRATRARITALDADDRPVAGVSLRLR